MFTLKHALPLLAVWGLAQAEPITIEHALGTAELDTPALRVVTLYQGATDAAVALGITPVGVVDSWVEKPMYEYLRDDLAGVPHVGLETQPNLEEIAALHPDVIIAAKMRHEAVYDQLNQIAPTIAHETVFQFKETLDLVAAATGKQAEAAAWHEQWNARIAEFQQRVRTLDGIHWPQQVALLNFRNDHARIYYSSFAGNILNELGFERPAAHREDVWGVKLTSKESIPAMNADVFFIFMTETDPTVMENYQEWTSHPLWNTLDAVRNGQVYRVNEVDWNMGGGPIAAQRMVDSVFEHYGLD
ncbi:ABC transporter substrate-binding protein [Saccharospirillum mangrovi]|uniref:ABC transporter substrate-binding protein n=1 Tax=Saccharospirillum mangrovi TaxID=2161747 RepID=UPI000D3794E8|nr:iron-siderophore ABC transporter substrate-binding protein [Saccharospirillum mangrovi]